MVETARPLFHRTSAEQEFRSRLVTCRSVSRIYSATQRSRQSHSRNRPPNQSSRMKVPLRWANGWRARTEEANGGLFNGFLSRGVEASSGRTCHQIECYGESVQTVGRHRFLFASTQVSFCEGFSCLSTSPLFLHSISFFYVSSNSKELFALETSRFFRAGQREPSQCVAASSGCARHPCVGTHRRGKKLFLLVLSYFVFVMPISDYIRCPSFLDGEN